MLFDKIIAKESSIAVIGLGYVGLPLAIELAKHARVIGFDLNSSKIEDYKNGLDPTSECGDSAVRETTLVFTSNEKDLDECQFFIVAVPTPVKDDNTPDLSPVIGASEIVGRHLKKADSVVVYESTVYPGVTEDVCVPIIQKLTSLTYGKDWRVGYSPERINPGDKEHRVWNICKIVSGSDAYALENIQKVYSLIIEKTYPVSSLKVAEAAKVLENSQRDINIAFMNEAAIIFHKLGIDTQEVIDAMNTKWNALHFKPGLVGGHCIGVDPYYLTYISERLGYHSRIILSGRELNDSMGGYIAASTIKTMIKAGVDMSNGRVLILGLAFKENCGDARNSKVFDIYRELKDYGLEVAVYDPVVSPRDAKVFYGIDLISKEELKDFDTVVVAVAHKAFLEMDFSSLFRSNHKILIDVKSALNKQQLTDRGFVVWRL